MKRSILLFLAVAVLSCGREKASQDQKIITVSIGPFRYFVEGIAGDEYKVNVMVPAGANPHIYEPYPEQIMNLRKSVAYVSNGFLGFEMTWLDRFYEINRQMEKLSLGDAIEPLDHADHHDDEHAEAADPHYWVSPRCALSMAASLKDFLTSLNPGRSVVYEANYKRLVDSINVVDKKAKEVFSSLRGKPFMIYHPNLGYLARDYGLTEVSVEYEGKEPPPSRLKELIDLARRESIRTIFVQKEYDTKNARAIAGEIGAVVKVIDPLAEDWRSSTLEMIGMLGESFSDPLPK